MVITVFKGQGSSIGGYSWGQNGLNKVGTSLRAMGINQKGQNIYKTLANFQMVMVPVQINQKDAVKGV